MDAAHVPLLVRPRDADGGVGDVRDDDERPRRRELGERMCVSLVVVLLTNKEK